PGMIWAHAMLPSINRFSDMLPGFTGNDKIGNYATIAALSGASGTNMTQIGVIVHELGHSLLGLPDLYDTGNFEDSRTDVNPIYTNGIGDWCIMSGGSWGLGGSAAFPSHVSGPLKYKFGFIEPVVLNREADSSAEDAEGRRIHGNNIGQVAPDPLTEDGWGSYEINAGSVDADAYYLVDLEPHSLVVRTQVDNANDLDSAAGIFNHTQLYEDTDRRWVEPWNDADRHVIPRESIAFIGGADGRGFFRGGLKSGLPFDAGIFLSTGSAARAAGPNASSNMSTDNGAGARSIAALDTLLRPMTMKDGKLEPLPNNEGYDRATTNAAGFSFDLLGSRKKISFDCVVATDAEATSDKNDIIAVIVDDKYGWLITRDELMERNNYNTALLKYDLDTDVDKDGIYDPEDPNVFLEDMDGDGIHDLLDPDKDGDGILDLPKLDADGKPVYPGEDLNGNGLLDKGEDTDDDGFLDEGEDLNGNGLLDKGEDTDKDGLLYVNEDVNGNGILDDFAFEDINKNGKLDPSEDLNGNGVLDPSEDLNGNAVLDPGEDLNNNEILDLGEDLNNNGILDLGEDLNGNGILDPTEDLNGNGILDIGDMEISFKDTDKDGIHDDLELDADGDGILDEKSTVDEDTNGNGRLDQKELDANNNTLLDLDEDINNNRWHDIVGEEDTNGNGLLDLISGDPEIEFKDMDGDGIHDNIDPDADGDFLLDYDKAPLGADGTPLLPNGDFNQNGKADIDEIFAGNGLVCINEDLNGDDDLTLPETPEDGEAAEAADGDDAEEDKGEDFYTNGKLDYGDPDIVFVDKDGDGNHDELVELISPHSFEGVETKYLKNGINDNRRDSNPP
ncbi:MAG: choice-of-anchor L domain-containing protein, partial [Sedimentisphaerales bacterium]|nr:choice-of-anchor L domain-containing protein [Sedimentisphaerales bacterium]